MRYPLIILILILAAAGWFVLSQNKPKTEPKKEALEVAEEKPVVKTAKLAAISPFKGEGIATKSFDGKTFVHEVVASLSEPSKGKFYEGWLVDKKPTLRFFSTGKMTKQNASFKLRFIASQDYPDYNDVVITEETEAQGLDGKPEAHVLEGSF